MRRCRWVGEGRRGGEIKRTKRGFRPSSGAHSVTLESFVLVGSVRVRDEFFLFLFRFRFSQSFAL